MSGYLLDTNCVSELVRPTPEPRVVEWMEAADEALLYLRVLTLGQIRKGLAALPQGQAPDVPGSLAGGGLAGSIRGKNRAD